MWVRDDATAPVAGSHDRQPCRHPAPRRAGDGPGRGHRWEKSFEEALKKAKATRRPLRVDFWAEGCGWCSRLDKTTYVDPVVAQKAEEFVAVKVNTEGSRKEMEVALRYDVQSLPTVLFLSPEGRPVHRLN